MPPSPPTPPAGEELPFAATLAAAHTGDISAIKQLYQHHAPQVARYLGHRGVPDVEVATKRVFRRAMRRLGSFEGDEVDFRGWLFPLARRQVAEELGDTMAMAMAEPAAGEMTKPVPAEEATLISVAQPAPARLRSLVGAHPARAVAVATLGLVGILAASGAPPFQRSASGPKVSSVDVSPPVPPPAATGPVGEGPPVGEREPGAVTSPVPPACPEDQGLGPATSLAPTSAGPPACDDPRSSTTNTTVARKTTTTVSPSTTTTAHPTTTATPNTTIYKPRGRSSY